MEKNVGWKFDNSYARLPQSFFSRCNPSSVPSPKLILLNTSLASDLGLNTFALKSEEGIKELGGNQVPNGAVPISQAYAGHQFGYFTMLGDGRAVLLGEQMTPDGKRKDIQLKGSGKTPYSRQGDGKATLGPMLREYLISEAMYGLGINTARSLAVVTTGESILREDWKIGAILTRVASSHLRVGTFEYVSNWGSKEELKVLADYTLKRHFPDFKKENNPYLFLLKQVVARQAELIANWQLVGFVHGVMNTDNMTICGETIDYGPCAFMDTFDPKTVFSSIDTNGRYAYGNQPQMAAWGLARFAETLLPLLDKEEEKAIYLAKEAVLSFAKQYQEEWLSGMRRKLGLCTKEENDQVLVEDLLQLMERYHADYTNMFRALTLDEFEQMEVFKSREFKEWYQRWQERLGQEKNPKEVVKQRMKQNNPAIIPRNHRVEEVLNQAVKGDIKSLEQFLSLVKNPYDYTKEQEAFALPPEPSDTPYRTFCGT